MKLQTKRKRIAQSFEKITFKVGVILEAEQTSANSTSVVFYIRRPNSALDVEQPVGHTGLYFISFGFFDAVC